MNDDEIQRAIVGSYGEVTGFTRHAFNTMSESNGVT